MGQGNVLAGHGNPVLLLVILGAISMAPFLAIMLTSFVKLSIVLSMIKSGLGTQVPPGQVTSGLAIVLTIFIMTPVAQDMYRASGLENESGEVFNVDNLVKLLHAADKGKEPMRQFLLKHAHAKDRSLFVSLGDRLAVANGAQPQADTADAIPRDQEFGVVLPAFVTSELKSAFEVSFLILIPFLVIDIVVANVLVALGLSMIQPATVSLPLKILLFVVADGWYLIVKGLVLSYA
jgi:type III secretion protein R